MHTDSGMVKSSWNEERNLSCTHYSDAARYENLFSLGRGRAGYRLCGDGREGNGGMGFV